MKKLLLSVVVILAGCGGGSSSDNSTPNINQSPTTTTQINAAIDLDTGPLFESTPILLPDLKEKYDLLCGSQVNVQNAIAIDLNNDGKKDLVFNLWCRQPNVISYNPTINTVVALIQLPNGTFVDKTKDIFGSTIIDIGGVGYGYITADFNNDGYSDIVFAVSREDGRANEGGESKNMMSQTVSLMSDGNGHYTQNRFGAVKWGDDVKLFKDSSGKNMALILPAGYSSPEIWSYNGTWNQITNYDWMQKRAVYFGVSSTFINNHILQWNNKGDGLEIWKYMNGIWNRILEYPYMPARIALMKDTPTSPIYQVHVLTVDGTDYIDDGGLYEGCALKRTLTGPTEIVYTFLGTSIPNGYTGQVLIKPENWMDSLPTLKLIAMGVTTENSNITPITLNTDKLDASFYHMECGDVNGDGLDDIFIRTTGTPILYINDGKGNFKKVMSNLMPAAIRGASHIYVDIDGDGVKDMLFFPIDRWQFDLGNYNTVQYKLYKGKRNVKSSEISLFSH